jgi:hypothetical protein
MCPYGRTLFELNKVKKFEHSLLERKVFSTKFSLSLNILNFPFAKGLVKIYATCESEETYSRTTTSI